MLGGDNISESTSYVGCHGMNRGGLGAGILEYTSYLSINLLLRLGSILQFYLSVLEWHGSNFDEDVVGEWFVGTLGRSRARLGCWIIELQKTERCKLH